MSPTEPARDEALPEPGAGPRADPLVQRALDRAIPADLLPADERLVTELARAVWMAEVTGEGRSQWPGYFPHSSLTAAYSRGHVQALIARHAPDSKAEAVVHLVWAGADPAGRFLNSRPVTLRPAAALTHDRTLGRGLTIRGCGVAGPKPWDVDGESWAVIEPLLPKIKRRVRHPGRKRHPDRLVFEGILFVLHTGIAWEHLPQAQQSLSVSLG